MSALLFDNILETAFVCNRKKSSLYHQKSHEVVHIIVTVVQAAAHHGAVCVHAERGALGLLALAGLGRLLLLQLGRNEGLGLTLYFLQKHSRLLREGQMDLNL